MISKYQLIRNIDESLTAVTQSKASNIKFDKDYYAFYKWCQLRKLGILIPEDK